MDSPYNGKNYRKKNNKPNTSITQTQNHTTNGITKNNKSNKKNVLKGGDPTNIHLTGKELIEQAFSNSSLENNQEDNTKLITIARRMVDNV